MGAASSGRRGDGPGPGAEPPVRRARVRRPDGRHLRPDPRRPPRDRRGCPRAAGPGARRLHPGRPAAAPTRAAARRRPRIAPRWSSWPSRAIRRSRSTGWRSSATGRRSPSTRSRRCVGAGRDAGASPTSGSSCRPRRSLTLPQLEGARPAPRAGPPRRRAPAGHADARTATWVEARFPGCARPRALPRRAAARRLVDRDPRSGSRRLVGPVPRAGGGARLHQRIMASIEPDPEERRLVTEPVPTPAHGIAPRRRPARSAAPAPRSPSSQPLDLARRIVELAEDKKAADIVLLDLPGLTTLADYFVIASGGSERQLDAIADGIIEGMRDDRRPADRPRGDARLALDPDRLRGRDRPRLHAAGARLLPAREALVGGEDDPARPVGTGPCRVGRRCSRGAAISTGALGTDGSCCLRGPLPSIAVVG